MKARSARRRLGFGARLANTATAFRAKATRRVVARARGRELLDDRRQPRFTERERLARERVRRSAGLPAGNRASEVGDLRCEQSNVGRLGARERGQRDEHQEAGGRAPRARWAPLALCILRCALCIVVPLKRPRRAHRLFDQAVGRLVVLAPLRHGIVVDGPAEP